MLNFITQSRVLPRRKKTEPRKYVPCIGEIIDRSKLIQHILYHVMPVRGNTEWVWRRHLAWLREVRPNFNGRLIVGIVTPGDGDHWDYYSPEVVQDILDGLNAEFITAPNDVGVNIRQGVGEGILFPEMLARLETNNPNHIAYYGHCKGVTRVSAPIDGPEHLWAEAMFETLFRNTNAVADALDDHSIAGPFLMRGGSHRPIGKPGVGPWWFFSGTFFAMRLTDVFRRNWRHLKQHYGNVEQWPRTNFEIDTQAKCLFFDDIDNLYDADYWRKSVTPKLKNWRLKRNDPYQYLRPLRASDVSVVITCKGRLDHLKQSLPSIISQSVREIIVVDYGCPDGTADWCDSLNNSQLKAIRVTADTDAFNPARARNIGANSASGRVLLFVDADTILNPEFTDDMIDRMNTKRAVLCTPLNSDGGRFGTAGVLRSVWESVRGYDESFSANGFGMEDIDLYVRVSARFPKHDCEWIDAEHNLKQIDHDDELRTRYFPVRDMQRSISVNSQTMLDTDRAVNPNGFGLNPADWRSVPGWFSEEDAAVYEPLLKMCHDEDVIEIGSYAGRSAVFAASILRENGCKLICVDKWDAIGNDANLFDLFSAADIRSRFIEHTRNHLDVISDMVMYSLTAASKMSVHGRKFGLIFIDADHTYDAVKSDILACWPLIRDGGVLCGHDFSSQFPGVQQAVAELLPEYQISSNGSSVWWVIKK